MYELGAGAEVTSGAAWEDAAGVVSTFETADDVALGLSVPVQAARRTTAEANAAQPDRTRQAMNMARPTAKVRSIVRPASNRGSP